jgi:hypothetical protein
MIASQIRAAIARPWFREVKKEIAGWELRTASVR